MRLDCCNVVSWVAGNKQQSGCVNGPGNIARFENILAMTAGAPGTVYLAEGRSIRQLSLHHSNGSNSPGRGNSPGDRGSLEPGMECTVSTLPHSMPQQGSWTALAYDPAGTELLASAGSAVCLVPPMPRPAAADGGGSAGSSAAPVGSPLVVAGQWSNHGTVDGVGTTARFYSVLGLLPAINWRTYILDYDKVRVMDSQRVVSTVLRQGVPLGYSGAAMLPSSCFVTYGYNSDIRLYHMGGSFVSAVNNGAFSLAKHLSMPAQVSSSGGGGGGSHGANTALVIIKARGEAFAAHRAVLAARSDYFRQLLQGSFAESSSGVVNLPDVEPEACGILLEYMYTDTLRVPESLLRDAMALAGRLLMPGVCQQLKPRLLAACCTPQTAAVDLLWAERHNATELLPALKAYFVKHHREIAAAAPDTVRQLLAGNQELAAEVVLAALTAL